MAFKRPDISLVGLPEVNTSTDSRTVSQSAVSQFLSMLTGMRREGDGDSGEGWAMQLTVLLAVDHTTCNAEPLFRRKGLPTCVGMSSARWDGTARAAEAARGSGGGSGRVERTASSRE